MINPSIILALSFGKGRGNSYGRANWAIAQWAVLHGKAFGALIVSDASVPIRKSSYATYCMIGNENKRVHESTVELLEAARRLYDTAGKEELREVLIVTATPYMRRALRDARILFRGTGITFYGAIIVGEEWFYPDSAQSRTISAWYWWPGEIILRILPFWLYRWLTKKLA